MTNLPIPPVPDLARARGGTRDELISFFIAYYSTDGAHFNYLAGTRSVKAAYKGLHNLEQLLAGCVQEKTKQGLKSNSDVVRLAAPLSFGRRTQVFDLPRRQFAFGRDLLSGYRIPFFFVENRVLKLYFLQPRKEFYLTYDQLCMVATIHKRFLLDTEFYGQKTDIEYVDVSADPVTKVREVRQYSLESLELWSEKRLADRLTLITEALEFVRENGLMLPKRRAARPKAPDMPLFD